MKDDSWNQQIGLATRFDYCRKALNFVALVALLAATNLLTSCTAKDPAGIFSVRNTPIQGVPGANPNSGNNANNADINNIHETGGEGGGSGEGEYGGAQASIPAPSLRKPIPECVLAYNPDFNPNASTDQAAGHVPVHGSACAIPPGYDNGDYWVVVGESEISESSAFNLNFDSSSKIRGKLAFSSDSGLSRLISVAHAQEMNANLQAICDQPNVACCPATTNGFECYYPLTNSSLSTVHAYFVRVTDNAYGPTASDPVRGDILWFKDQPIDLASRRNVIGGASELYSLTQPATNSPVNGIKITGATGPNNGPGAFNVNTDYTGNTPRNGNVNYTQVAGNFSATANENALVAADGYVGLRNAPSGINLRNFNAQTGFVEPTGVLVSNAQEINRYNILKYTRDGKIRLGVEAAGNLSKIYRVPTPSVYLADPTTFSRDDVISFDRILVGQGSFTHFQTVAFDVAGNNCGVIVFEDINRSKRMRMACRYVTGSREDYVSAGGFSPISGDGQSGSYKDLIIYHTETINPFTGSGKALLLDNAQEKVWMIDYRYNTRDPRNLSETFITETLNGQSNGNGIPVGSNPQSIVISPDDSKAYIINQDDDTLSVLTLKVGSQPRRVNEIRNTMVTWNLRSTLAGETLTLQPKSVVYQAAMSGDYLVIGSQGLQGALVIPVEDIPIPTTTNLTPSSTFTPTININNFQPIQVPRVRNSPIPLRP